MTAGVKAKEAGLNYVLLEKGRKLFQGIIDSYPKGKKVYPTIPKNESGSFPLEGLTPPKEKLPVESYIDQVKAYVDSEQLHIQYEETFDNIEEKDSGLIVKTDKDNYVTKNVIFAFGSNIPNELGIYGEAKTVARNIVNATDYIGISTLVLGGGNAAADIVASLSKIKREANDKSPVYWGHIREKFAINKNTARDLGEEILLGGQIRILQGAEPKIGEVDSEGIDRLYIHQSASAQGRDDVFVYQGMSFPMKNVIACVGTHGPSAIFNKLVLQQITCTGEICHIAREGHELLLLTRNLQTSRKGLYAIGGSISPAYMEIQQDGAIKEKKHSNVIYMAMKDAVTAVQGILSKRDAAARAL